MKNETLNIKQFCELDLKQQKAIATGLFINLKHLKEKIYDLEYQLEFDIFAQDRPDIKIEIDKEIEQLRNEINKINIKINIVNKVINNFIIWES